MEVPCPRGKEMTVNLIQDTRTFVPGKDRGLPVWRQTLRVQAKNPQRLQTHPLLSDAYNLMAV